MKFIASVTRNPLHILILLGLFIVALFFRTYHYIDRVYVYADNALFVQAAYYANQHFKLPQIGPFAQAPFFTGPWWLWIIQLMFFVPLGILTPWYFMTFFSLISIYLMYLNGREIGGNKLGLVTAVLTTISTAQIDNWFMTWNASADPFLGMLAILFFIKYIKNQRPLFIFLLGFSISLAFSIHFQTFLLSPLILVALLSRRPKLKNIVALALGVFIPLIPFLYFDVRFHWFETRRILDYVLIGQHRIYVPNRWLTYAGVFWPTTWSWIIGGAHWVGYMIVAAVSLVSFVKFFDFRKHIFYFVIAISFVLSVIAFRYYKGERLYYYTNFAHGFVLLLTAWTMYHLYKWQKLLGVLFSFIVIYFSVQASIGNIAPRAITYSQIKDITAQIYAAYPATPIDLYECPFSGSMISTPVSYQMYYDGRNEVGGTKIGVCNESLNLTWRPIEDFEADKEYRYQNISTQRIYKDMTEWWIKNPPGKELYE